MNEKISKAEILHFCLQRGLLKTITNQTKLVQAIQQKKAIYCGFDPSAETLHIGHFLPLYVLKQFHSWGCPVIIVLGGLTAFIGDPSFRTQKRALQTETFFVTNTVKITAQIKQLLPFAQIVNNLSWYQKLSLPSFLKQTGKAFTINKMLEKESISQAYQKQGLFFDELSYLLLQAYDFYHLFQTQECYIQLGGSDQFPNITMGLDLITKLNPQKPSPAVGITTPLVTINGQKISKTDPSFLTLDLQTSTLYNYYQFFLNLPDQDLKQWKQWLDLKTTKSLHKTNLQALKLLLATKIIDILFPSKLQKKWQELVNLLAKKDLGTNDLQSLALYFPVISLATSTKLGELLAAQKICQSRSELRRAFKAKSIKVNQQIITDWNHPLELTKQGELLTIKLGKKIVLLLKH